MQIKKIVSLLVCLALMLCMIPATGIVASATEEKLCVGIEIVDADGLSLSSLELEAGSPVKLYAKTMYSDGSSDYAKDATWGLDNSIATLSGNQGYSVTVTPTAEGLVNVYCRYIDPVSGNFFYSIEINVIGKAMYITLLNSADGQYCTDGNIRLNPGDLTMLRVIANYDNGNSRKNVSSAATLTSSDETIVSVSGSQLTSQNEGVAQITVSYTDSDGNTDISVLTVKVGIYNVNLVAYAVYNEQQTNHVECYVDETFYIVAYAEIIDCNEVYTDKNIVISSSSNILNISYEEVTALIAGDAIIECGYIDQDGNEYISTISVYAITDPNDGDTVHEVAITDIDDPAGGEKPDYDANTKHSGYSLFNPIGTMYDGYIKNGIVWYDYTAGVYLDPETAVFEEDHTYSVLFFIKADEGKSLASSATYYFNYISRFANPINGYSSTEAVMIAAAREFTINEIADVVIDQVSITLDPPVVGRTPDLTPEAIGSSEGWEFKTVNTAGYASSVVWFDETDGFYLSSTDTFENGHTYSVNVIISASAGYDLAVDSANASTITTELEIGIARESSVSEVNGYSAYSAISIGATAITPYEEHNIYVSGGYATNASGEVVSKAAYGDVLTLTYEIPEWYLAFTSWQVNYGTPVINYNPDGSVTLEMCDYETSVTALYTDTTSTVVTVVISDIDHPVVGRTPDYEATVPENVGYTIGAPEEYTHYTNGIIWYDATTGSIMDPTDTFVDGHEYYYIVAITVKDGYKLYTTIGGVASALNVTLNGNTDVELKTMWGTSTAYPLSKYVAASLSSDSYLTPYNTFHTITCSGCTPSFNGEYVTTAACGDKIYVGSALPLDGYMFVNFSGTDANGNEIIFDDPESMYTYFIMPDCAVSITSNIVEIPKIDITSVSIGLDHPLAGRPLDFTVELPEGSGYTTFDPEGLAHFSGGVAWYDVTAEAYVAVGDNAISGHIYYPVVFLKAENAYQFVDSADILGSNNLSAYTTIMPIDGYSSSEYICVIPGSDEGNAYYLTPTEPYAITVVNGNAYNSAGEIVTHAFAGEEITVSAFDETGIMTFNYWSSNQNVVFNPADSETSLFVMGEGNITITAIYTPRPIESIDLWVDGYFADNDVDNVIISAFADGLTYCNHPETGEAYAFFIEAESLPDTQYTSDILSSRELWLRLMFEKTQGYGLPNNLSDMNINIVVDGIIYEGVAISVEDWGDYLEIYFDLGVCPLLTRYGINITDGIAYYNNIQVEYAPAGFKVFIDPIAPMEGKIFNSWQVNSGDITIETDDSGKYFFYMPESGVSISALFRGAIYNVYVYDLAEPTPNGIPSYDVTFYGNDGYELYNYDSYGFVNGICWTKVIDAVSSEKVDPETGVFEPGETYTVNIFIKAQDSGYWFAFDNPDHPFTAYINGYPATVSSTGVGEISEYIALSYTFTIPELYSITVNNGTAYTYGDKTDATGAGELIAVTESVAGNRIKLVADNLPEGYKFIYWRVDSGDFTFTEDEMYYDNIYINMPESDLVVTAVCEQIVSTLSGTITINCDTLSAVTIELYKDGELFTSYSRVPNSNQLSYSFTDIPIGIYEIKARMEGCAEYYDEIIVYENGNTYDLTLNQNTADFTVHLNGALTDADVTVELWNMDGTELLYSATAPATEGKVTVENVLFDYYLVKTLSADHEPIESAFGFASAEDRFELNLFIFGDINDDGVCNIKDLVRLKKIIAGLETQSGSSPDRNGDIIVDALDLAIFRKFMLGIKE